MTDKIIIYKDGKTYYVPTNIIGYGAFIEINGALIENPTSSKYIASTQISSMRLATRTNVPSLYIYGDEHMKAKDYDTRLAELQSTYKEKIDEKFDDDGYKMNVCIWKDKNAEKEFYRLTNKFTRIDKPIVQYGEYLKFEVVTLPKNNSKYIIPDWKTSDLLTDTCTFMRQQMMSDMVNRLKAENPSLEVTNYIGSSSSSVYINHNSYVLPIYNKMLRGTLAACKQAEKEASDAITKWFALELGKIQQKPLQSATATLNAVNKIYSLAKGVQTKVATKRTYVDCTTAIYQLKLALEQEISL
jgi:hypothetical protein